MNELAPFAALAAATGPAPDPIETVLTDAARAADRLAACLLRGSSGDLPKAVVEARMALAAVEPWRAAMLHEAAPATDDEIEEQLERLVHAFPEGSPEDLAGYGAQLADDIAALRPSRRALRLGCEQVRLHRRYSRLPSIATVWDAVKSAEADVRTATGRLDALPDRIARAEAALVSGRPRRTKVAA